ncbi:related to reticuline oxidase precursor; berberine bridge enzyme [Rhynchosporium agropyri]|uniref:Related to reticuline oxidase berberine bridge enzyme n=1 Tax=Rhynchosporium agropyri TaxID=914238 RepID=A0A1E1KLA9_9HELO|nr:related to reticuline oxidase precursor; berberine bridge enzyme [Rhynchosporium agropyri]
MVTHVSLFALWLLTVEGAFASVQRRATVTDCLAAANVPRFLSGTPEYTMAIRPYNARLPVKPLIVTTPRTVAHVQAAVACGAQHKIPVTARGGGHDYAAHGLGGEDGHLIVDMKMFTNVTVDSSTQVACVGSGSRLGNVAIALFEQGERAISHGTCASVGVGGHVTGGGYGYASRTHGLALDNLVEATIVLANSTVVSANKTKNADLFWAIRGAGASFGIITEYKFQTWPAPSNSTIFYFYYNFTQKQAVAMHKGLQEYANTSMPSEMNMRMSIDSRYPYQQLEGVYYGSQEDFSKAIAPLLAKAPFSGGFGFNRTAGWIDTLTTFAYSNLSTPLDFFTSETFFAKSLMTVDVTDTAMESFWAYWHHVLRKHKRSWYLLIDLHGGPSSAISKVPDGDTSYPHRNALLKYQFHDSSSGEFPSDGFSVLNGWVESLTKAMPETTIGMYVNYADTSLSTAEAHKLYWLKHYPKLTKVKHAYDPHVVFSNPQSIGLS